MLSRLQGDFEVHQPSMCGNECALAAGEELTGSVDELAVLGGRLDRFGELTDRFGLLCEHGSHLTDLLALHSEHGGHLAERGGDRGELCPLFTDFGCGDRLLFPCDHFLELLLNSGRWLFGRWSCLLGFRDAGDLESLLGDHEALDGPRFEVPCHGHRANRAADAFLGSGLAVAGREVERELEDVPALVVRE